MNKLTIYTIITPPEANFPISYRWKLETNNATIVQNGYLETIGFCVMSYKAWIRHHWPNLIYQVKHKTISDLDLIV